VFVQNAEPLVQLRALLRSRVVGLTIAASLAEVNVRQWQEFQPAAEDEPAPTRSQQEDAFLAFKQALSGTENLAKFEKGVAAALAPLERRGLLVKFPRELDRGNEEIVVYPTGHREAAERVKISDVLLDDGKPLRQSLRTHLDSTEVADRVLAWLRPRLRDTLTLDEVETRRALDEAAAGVGEVLVKVEAGHTLARAGQPLDKRQVTVLQLEYEAAMAARGFDQKLARAAAMVLAIFSMFVLSGAYMRYRQHLFPTLQQWGLLLLLAAVTVVMAYAAAADAWRAELIPLLLFGMSTAIAYRQELALLLSGCWRRSSPWPLARDCPASCSRRAWPPRRSSSWARSAAGLS